MNDPNPKGAILRRPARSRRVRLLLAGILGSGASWAPADFTVDVGRGPINIHTPPAHDPNVPTPLVLLLHGYSSNGAEVEAYMRFLPLADEFGFLFAFPDGTRDILGNRFWNATDACCNFFASPVDDSGYLLALIDEVKAQVSVNSRRVHLIGHSNGGFMCYRMACDHADVIASVASLAGATWLDPNACLPAAPVHVLQIHGTADLTILYNGGCLGAACYPAAIETVEQWATFDGCALIAESGDPLDLDAGIPGSETVVIRYTTDCDPAGSAELWSIVGGGHVPNLSADFSRLVVEYLFAHPKPGSDILGDLNCDGSFNGADIDPFFLALGDPVEYAAAFPGCDILLADMNGDGSVNGADIDVFFLCLGGGCP